MREKDRSRIRALAARWREIAEQPIMQERRRQWTALKDLRAERPMVLFETWTLEDYVSERELQCEDPLLRSVEGSMLATIRQAEEIGDDTVVEPCWRIGWDIRATGYGVDIPVTHAVDLQGGHIGYAFDHPIRSPEDIDRLQPRTWEVDRASSERKAERLTEAFGDLLPVVLHGSTALHAGLTSDLYRLIGNDRLLTWLYDEPEAIRRLMAYLRDDRLAMFDWMEREGLLGSNNLWTFVGSGSPGYTTSLPPPSSGPARLKDLWLWMESQETVCISPRMFGEFFLPCMAAVCERFGLIYYGCCEPVHDRWERIVAAIPHIRAVSISPWCDKGKMAEMAGQSVVFSRKPRPAPISGDTPDWDALRQDIVETLAAFRGCNLEIIFRDVYRINGDRPRLRKWVEMTRDLIEAQ
jgi:hypothetical protein